MVVILGDDSLIEFTVVRFNGGEINTTISSNISSVSRIRIECYFQSSDDIIIIALLMDSIRGLTDCFVELFLPYMPAARQDRVSNFGESFGLRVYVDLLKSLSFDKITVVDPHSDVVSGMFPSGQLRIVTQSDIFKKSLSNIKNTYGNFVLLAPDAGAEKKTKSIAHSFDVSYYVASKSRDTKTGKLSDTRIPDDLPNGKSPIVIVDDILDGGGTFINLINSIRQSGNNSTIILCVTHGIFSKGWLSEFELFDEIIVGYMFNESIGGYSLEEPRKVKVLNFLNKKDCI